MQAISLKNIKWTNIILLFLVMMLSGGNHIFPRNPICLFVIIVYGWRILRNSNVSRLISYRIWWFLAAFFVIAFFHTLKWNMLDSAALATLSNIIAGLCVFIYYKQKGVSRLIQDITVLMKIIIILGLISYLIGIVDPELFRSYTFVDSYGTERTIRHIGFVLFSSISTDGSSRLAGYFWEPGIYQIYLNIFLLIQMLFYKERGWMLLAIVSIFLTKSTAGFIILLVLMIFAIWQRRSIVSIIGMMLMTIIAWNYVISPNINEKFKGEQSGSAIARQADLIAGLTIAWRNPLIGIGANTDRFKSMRSQIAWQGGMSGIETAERDSSNGIVSLSYCWGIPLALFYLWGLIKQRIITQHKWLMAILLVVSLNSEPLALSPFFLIFAYSGFDSKYS